MLHLFLPHIYLRLWSIKEIKMIYKVKLYMYIYILEEENVKSEEAELLVA